MPYVKTTWKDRIVQNPRTYTTTNNADGSITLTPKEGTISEPGTPLSALNLNNIENGITTLELSSVVLTASGTANAITLPITLSDKSKYSFKAVSNSTGSVTVNGVALKKPDGTIVNNIKANKVYDVYYDQSQSSVFILAKASGTAQVGDVLAGTTFSNDNDTDLVGTATITSLGGKRFVKALAVSPTGYGPFVYTIPNVPFLPTSAVACVPTNGGNYYASISYVENTQIPNVVVYAKYNGSTYTRKGTFNWNSSTKTVTISIDSSTSIMEIFDILLFE